jgi:biotin synthase
LEIVEETDTVHADILETELAGSCGQGCGCAA